MTHSACRCRLHPARRVQGTPPVRRPGRAHINQLLGPSLWLAGDTLRSAAARSGCGEEWRATTVRLAPTTRRSYNVLLDNHVPAWFGDRLQASIDFLEVERFIAAKLASGLGPKRVRAAVSVLSLVIRLVVRAGGRKDNPAAAHVIRQRRRKLQPGEAMTMEDVAALAAVSRDAGDVANLRPAPCPRLAPHRRGR